MCLWQQWRQGKWFSSDVWSSEGVGTKDEVGESNFTQTTEEVYLMIIYFDSRLVQRW